MGIGLRDRVLANLEERRERALSGNVNAIPSPFKRFQSDFLGIEQGKYILLSAATKVGKTQISSYLFIYNTILYAYKHPDKIRIKIFYYPLEETPESILLRFMSYLLYTMSGFTIEISTVDLKSTREGVIVDERVLQLLKSKEYDDIIKFFEEHVIFSDSRNATGVYMECKKYAEENGVSHYRKIKKRNDLGEEIEVNTFEYYEPNDKDEYRIIFLDHASLISEERGMSLKQSIDKLSEYFVILRNRYNFTPVLIQQQAFSSDTGDNAKANDGRPTLAGLADSKYPARDCNICLGLFSPFKMKLDNYKGYDIKVLKDNFRLLEVLINRDGAPGGMTGLYFNGATCYFQQLPLPESVEMAKVYNKLKSKQKQL